MNTLLRLMLSVWLLMLLAVGQSLSATASALPPVLRSCGYDGQTQASIICDDTPLSAFDYDSASAPASNENDNRIVGTGGIFGAIARLIAAKDAGQGFKSFSSFKRALGPAGGNAQWHHIVEQTPGNLERFGAQKIHSVENHVRLPTGTHRQISGFYSSKQPFTGGQTVRRWLSTQSLQAQQQFGGQVMELFGAPLP